MTAALSACVCGAPSARDGVCDACFDRQCAAVRASLPARTALACTGCGRETAGAGLCGECAASRLEAELARRQGEERARVDEHHARLAASPHACTCGVKLLKPGLCRSCGDAQREQQRRRDLVDVAMSALPKLYRDNALDAVVTAQRLKDPTALPRALAACRSSSVWIVLVGPAAVGKTTLGAAIYRRLVELRVERHEAHERTGGFLDARAASLARLNHSLGSESPIVERALEAELPTLRRRRNRGRRSAVFGAGPSLRAARGVCADDHHDEPDS